MTPPVKSPIPLSPQADLSFKNEKISKYFEGLSDVAPENELMYIHTHLVKVNFLSEVEAIVLKTAESLETRERTGVRNRLAGLSRQYAKLTNNVTKANAKPILEVLRDIYSVCKNVLKAEGKWNIS